MQSSNLGTLTQELMAAGMPAEAGDVDEIIRSAGWKSTGATILIATVWKKAVGGDVNAAKLIREMNGETADSVLGFGCTGAGLNGNNGSGAFDVSAMSDDALKALLNGMETETDNHVEDADNVKSDIERSLDKENDNSEIKKKNQDTCVVPW